jgi:hypothetical protein
VPYRSTGAQCEYVGRARKLRRGARRHVGCQNYLCRLTGMQFGVGGLSELTESKTKESEKVKKTH